LIADADQIAELLAGDVDELVISHQPPRVGTEQHPVQPAVGKRARCWVNVIESWRHNDGRFVVRVELAASPHRPRLLAPSRAGNYTSDPTRAITDAGEAVPIDYQGRITDEAHRLGHQENVRREVDYLERRFVDRLEDAIVEAEELGLNTSRDMARLEQTLAKIRSRNARARQQRAA
jgi:hypothetical protein